MKVTTVNIAEIVITAITAITVKIMVSKQLMKKK